MMRDTIYRDQAINAVDIGNLHRGIVEALQNIISELPSAEKTGKWIISEDSIENIVFDECRCSECGCVEYFNKGYKKFNYCPNCGARMIENE